MRDSRKALLSTISFTLVICVMSSFFVVKGSIRINQHNDSDIRKSYSGTINYLFNGASHLKTGLNPEIIDKKLGCNSYNLSGDAISWKGRYYLLKEEIERNPVKTVVFELSFDTFTRSDKAEYILYILPRLSSTKERFSVLLDASSIDGINVIFNAVMSFGYEVCKAKFQKDDDYPNYYESYIKGHAEVETNNIELSDSKEIISTYNSELIEDTFNAKSIKYFRKSIELCNKNDINIIFIVMPVADSKLWKTSNFDDVMNKVKNVTEQHGNCFIDFNLLKNRYDILSDKDCYKNGNHLSPKGAAAFSETYCEIMKKINSGEDISDLFYTSYEEMKADSPYMKTYKSLTQAE